MSSNKRYGVARKFIIFSVETFDYISSRLLSKTLRGNFGGTSRESKQFVDCLLIWIRNGYRFFVKLIEPSIKCLKWRAIRHGDQMIKVSIKITFCRKIYVYIQHRVVRLAPSISKEINCSLKKLITWLEGVGAILLRSNEAWWMYSFLFHASGETRERRRAETRAEKNFGRSKVAVDLCNWEKDARDSDAYCPISVCQIATASKPHQIIESHFESANIYELAQAARILGTLYIVSLNSSEISDFQKEIK